MNFWDYNVWSNLLQFGFLAILIVVANTLIRKIKPLKATLLPVAVVAGFVALVLKLCGVLDLFLKADFLNKVTYHAIMIGFVALGLNVKKAKSETVGVGPMKSGLFIVSNYLLQAAIGMGVTLLLLPAFPAAGLLLPMGYGQGPGQANNIGMQFELKGFVGGQAFGLSVASIGFLFACIGGVIYLNYLVKKGKTTRAGEISGQPLTNYDIEDPNEIPLSQAIDKFSFQVCLVLLVCVLSYGLMWLLTYLTETFIGGNFVENTVKPLVWGFNFIFGTLSALIVSKIFVGLKKAKLMNRQYPNNYMLNRIAGCAFDFMIVASIAAIDIEKLEGLWLPLILICTLGGVVTFVYIKKMCDRIYPEFPIEATMGFFGMLTGTISTGMILLREVDPMFKSRGSDALVVGSTTAIIFGFPLLLLIGIAPDSPGLVYVLIVVATAISIVCLWNWSKWFNRGKKAKLSSLQEETIAKESTEEKE